MTVQSESFVEPPYGVLTNTGSTGRSPVARPVIGARGNVEAPSCITK
jgi:hypothetical protein